MDNHYIDLEEVRVSSLVTGERLRPDGSNFVPWFGRLREMLIKNNLLRAIRAPLGAMPTNVNDFDKYRVYKDNALVVQWAILASMDPQLRQTFEFVDPYEIIDHLKTVLFSDQVRLGRYECSKCFFSVKMGENGNLLDHIMIMETLYDELTNDWECWTDHGTLIHGVLASLPPSYENVVKEYVLAGNPQYFLEFMKWLKTKQILHTDVEGAGSNEIEVIDVTGIYDILDTNVVCCFTGLSI